jgi:hypothetical protein
MGRFPRFGRNQTAVRFSDRFVCRITTGNYYVGNFLPDLRKRCEASLATNRSRNHAGVGARVLVKRSKLGQPDGCSANNFREFDGYVVEATANWVWFPCAGEVRKGREVMRKVLGTASVALAAAGCVVIGPAGPAAADPELVGTYTVTLDGTQATTTGFAAKNPQVRTEKWIITSCGAGCAHVSMPDKPAMANSGDLHLNNGRWEMTQEYSLMHCGAGPDITLFTSFDAATLQGTQENTNHCVGDNKITTPMTLALA